MRDTALSILLVSDSQDTVADIVTTYTQHSPRSTLNIVHNLVEARAFLSQNTPDIALVRYQLSDGNAPELIDGNGSTFRIYLPKVETSDSQEETDEHIDVSVEGDETILLVEDDDSVRELLTLTLEQFGYVILSARDGEGALVTARRHKGPIALMITDIVMTRMSGHELATIIAPLQPKMSVLYISGYDDDMASDQGIVDVENAFLQKPFSPTDIARKVRTILDNI